MASPGGCEVPPRPLWSDRQVQTLIGNLLRFGVLTAAVTVLIGGIVYLGHAGHRAPHYQAFTGVPSDLRSLPGILASARSFDGRGLIQFGLLILIATPVARVSLSILAFAGQRDWVYTLVTSCVLGVLLYSLVGGGL